MSKKEILQKFFDSIMQSIKEEDEWEIKFNSGIIVTRSCIEGVVLSDRFLEKSINRTFTMKLDINGGAKDEVTTRFSSLTLDRITALEKGESK